MPSLQVAGATVIGHFFALFHQAHAVGFVRWVAFQFSDGWRSVSLRTRQLGALLRILDTFAQMRIAQVRQADDRIERYREEERQIARMAAERTGLLE